jgi:hypothetical protein
MKKSSPALAIGNANQNVIEIPPHPSQNDNIISNTNNNKCSENVRKRNTSTLLVGMYELLWKGI